MVEGRIAETGFGDPFMHGDYHHTAFTRANRWLNSSVKHTVSGWMNSRQDPTAVTLKVERARRLGYSGAALPHCIRTRNSSARIY
jgi:hypothetical protein